MSPGYRPELRWMLMGPLLGALSGTVVAFTVLMVVSPSTDRRRP